MSQLNTPVLFLVFNRLAVTKLVFAEIARAKPPRLYIACDGPRANKPGEAQIVKELQEYLLANINWECEVKTLFRTENLGCGRAVSDGISWFFSHEPMGIILEDDCLPSPSFFQFCQELLVKYRDDKRIWQIAGYSVLQPNDLDYASYYFSQMTMIWGWASWADRWQGFDLFMHKYPEFLKRKYLNSITGDYRLKVWHKQLFDANVGRHDTWDCQWYFMALVNHGISVTPKISMIQNIGFETANSTHPAILDKTTASIVAGDMEFPLVHPEFFCPDPKLEGIYYKWRTRNGVFLKIITQPIRLLDERLFNKRIINLYKQIFAK